MALAWYVLKIMFPNDPKLRVMGLFGCTHKTVAIGVPLINAIYEGNPAIGLYTLPLLIWHPMQLIIGTFLTPRLAKFVQQEQERLRIAAPCDGAADSSESNGEDAESPEELWHVETAEESLDVKAAEKGRAVTKPLMVGRKKIIGRSGSLLPDF
jgi:hypothetical protein